jgi:hypothetical protein
MRFLLPSMLALSLAPAWAQTCSSTTVRATYSVTCSGFLSPAANTPQVPASIIGTITIEFNGVVAGAAKMSLGGGILDQAVAGNVVINNDCTGSVSYDQKINGQSAGKLNILFHVLDNGKEIRGMIIDPGTTLSCNLRLMSR